MAWESKRKEDNGDEKEYRRSIIGDTKDIVKLLVFSGVIGTAGNVGYTQLKDYREPPFTEQEKAVLVDRIDHHLSPSAMHETSEQKAERIRNIYTREFLPVIKRLEEKIDIMTKEIDYIKRKVR